VLAIGSRRTLRVRTRRYVALADWELTEDGWRCIAADGELAWMVGMSGRTARTRLARKRLAWEWLTPA
jgi:hypothetical protein